MKKVLVAYVTHSGSTQEVAEFMGGELRSQGLEVDVKPISKTLDISGYQSVVAGGLLYRFGWHTDAVNFLKQNVEALQGKKVALFIMGLGLAKTADIENAPFPLFVDPGILRTPVSPKDPTKPMNNYLQASLPTIEQIKPVSLAFFAGKLDYGKLNLVERLILQYLMRQSGGGPGDFRNWKAIRSWVLDLCMGE